MEHVAVVLIKDSVVDSVDLYVGDHDEITSKAEARFLYLCKDNISNWDEHTADDIDNILSDGYYEFGAGNSVCITWPEVFKLPVTPA